MLRRLLASLCVLSISSLASCIPDPPQCVPPPTSSLVSPANVNVNVNSVPSSLPPSSLPPSPASPDPAQLLADLSSCPLASGERIDSCHLGYRTFGALDATKSNAILFPTWFSGTTKPLVDIVPDKLVDTKRFFLVLVDALGDGISTSPSNSRTQPRLAFPRFTIKDMVDAQHRLLTEVLGITHLRAVMGISMGGMQAIEWGVEHPDFVDRIVPIVGTPQLTSNDLLLWTTELHALENDVSYQNGNYAGRPLIRSVLDLHMLALTTPAYRASQTSREAFAKFTETTEADASFDWNDWHRQLEAMLAHDVTKPYGGTIEGAAKRMKAKALFVVADQDHMVSPIPARALARAMGANARVVSLDGPCGHIAPTCEQPKLAQAVQAFLAP